MSAQPSDKILLIDTETINMLLRLIIYVGADTAEQFKGLKI